MQKVSKQSLAMLALSILLAISIALTFTFAAVTSQSKTATGTITFDGQYSVAWNAEVEGIVTEVTGGNVKFTLDQATYFDLDTSGANVKATLKADKLADLAAISVLFSNASGTTATYSFTNTGDGVNLTYQTTYASATKTDLVAGKTAKLTLNQIISSIEVPSVAAESYEFVITATIEEKA